MTDSEDVLISLTIKNGQDLKERALSLQQKGQEIAEWGQGQTELLKQQLEKANGVVEDVKSAVLNDAPLDSQAVSEDQEILSSYVYAAMLLGALAVGEIVGKWVGVLFLGWWLSNGVSFFTVVAIIPGLYASLKYASSPPSSEDMVNIELGMALTLGLLSGYNLGNYPAISFIPLAIIPAAQAAMIRWVAPKLGNDRKVVSGVVAGGWIVPVLILGLIGGVTLASVCLWLVAGGVSFAAFHLVLNRKEIKSQWITDFGILAMLELAVIIECLLTVMMMQTYQQLRDNPPPPSK